MGYPLPFGALGVFGLAADLRVAGFAAAAALGALAAFGRASFGAGLAAAGSWAAGAASGEAAPAPAGPRERPKCSAVSFESITRSCRSKSYGCRADGATTRTPSRLRLASSRL